MALASFDPTTAHPVILVEPLEIVVTAQQPTGVARLLRVLLLESACRGNFSRRESWSMRVWGVWTAAPRGCEAHYAKNADEFRGRACDTHRNFVRLFCIVRR
jgi:hypothetical protein